MRRWLITFLLLALPWLAIYRHVLFANETPVFRDAGNFYYPLFAWTQQQWANGQFPLWNPNENAGSSVLADSSSSLFYPGKLLFFLPAEYSRLYSWYIALHSFAACLFCFWWLRSCRVSESAAVVAAWTYAYGGTVLQLHCNVVFLVGAAWLPVTLAAGNRISKGRPIGVLGLAFALSMMVLGGDPQMAYMSSLLVAVWIWSHRKQEGSIGFMRPMGKVGVAATWAIGLAALQVFPSSAWSRNSERANYDQPRSIYEAVSTSWATKRSLADTTAPLLEAPADGHHTFVFDFSLPPWRVVDAALPNYFGRVYPENRRWSLAAESDLGIWTPSLFIGVLPLALGCAFGVLRSWRTVDGRWPLVVSLVSLVGSFGAWGLGWGINMLVEHGLEKDPGLTGLGDQSLGVYWLFTVALPGFVYFRYPAKLLVLTALAFSLLTARGWDESFECPKFRKSILVLLVLSGVLSGVIYGFTIRHFWVEDEQVVAQDDYFGNLTAIAVRRDLFHSLAVAGVSFFLSFVCIRVVERRQQLARFGAAAVVLVGLVYVNSWIVASVSDDAFQVDQKLVDTFHSNPVDQNRTFFFTIIEAPAEWSEPSPRRCHDILQWETKYLLGRTPLLIDGCSLLGVEHSIEGLDWRMFLDRFQHTNTKVEVAGFLAAAGVRYYKPPPPITLNSHSNIESPLMVLKHNHRAWLAKDIIRKPPLVRRSPAMIAERTKVLLDQIELTKTVMVECPDSVELPKSLSISGEVKVLNDFGTRLEMQAALDGESFIVIRDQYDDGWIAEVSTDGGPFRTVPMWRTNRVFRGLLLPAGRHEIRLAYRPTSFVVGVWVSGFSWVLMLLAVVQRLRRTIKQ